MTKLRLTIYASSKEEAAFAAGCGWDFLNADHSSIGYVKDEMYAVCRGAKDSAIIEVVRFEKKHD